MHIWEHIHFSKCPFLGAACIDKKVTLGRKFLACISGAQLSTKNGNKTLMFLTDSKFCLITVGITVVFPDLQSVHLHGHAHDCFLWPK